VTTDERERIRSAGAAWAKAHPLTEEKNRRLRALTKTRAKGAAA
jgi:hypothetical protein